MATTPGGLGGGAAPTGTHGRAAQKGCLIASRLIIIASASHHHLIIVPSSSHHRLVVSCLTVSSSLHPIVSSSHRLFISSSLHLILFHLIVFHLIIASSHHRPIIVASSHPSPIPSTIIVSYNYHKGTRHGTGGTCGRMLNRYDPPHHVGGPLSTTWLFILANRDCGRGIMCSGGSIE